MISRTLTNNYAFLRTPLWLLIFNLLISETVLSSEINGIVIKISDGDTLTLLTASKTQVNIRLANIDAPEKGQRFGNKAKQHLSDLAYKKHVLVKVKNTDRYGRHIGHVSSQNTDMSTALIKQGLAWVYRKYSNDPNLIRLEALAKQSKLGIWMDEHPIAPWDWRKGQRTSSEKIKHANLIIGNKRSRIYHLYNCRSYEKVSKNNQVFFSSEKNAALNGFRKAGDCP